MTVTLYIPSFVALVIITILIVVPILWKCSFKHIYDSRKLITVSIREAILPDLHKASAALTTLSASAIALSLTASTAIGQPTSESLSYLRSSWILFLAVIICGTIFNLSLFAFRIRYHTMIKSFDNLQNSQDEGSKTKELALQTRSILNKIGSVEAVVLLLIFLQAIFFILACILLTTFALVRSGATFL